VTLIWTQSASCQLSVVTPQVGSGTQYIFSQWQDGTTSTTDTVSAPVTSAVYTASFTAGPAGLYSPTQGSTLAGSSATFEWYGPQGTTAFWIDVGSSAGGNNYYQSGSLPTSTVSATVNSLPTSGGQVYVTLYWLLNGSWVSNPYTFTAAGGGSALATLQSPNGGSALCSTSETFSWKAPTGAPPYAYWIDVGTAPGSNNGLPVGGNPLYVTLYTEVSKSQAICCRASARRIPEAIRCRITATSTQRSTR